MTVNLQAAGVQPGNTIRLRYDMGMDGCSGLVGWYVDDVNVYACEGTPTAVNLTDISARSDLPAPFSPALPLAVLPMATGLAAAAAYAVRRKR